MIRDAYQDEPQPASTTVTPHRVLVALVVALSAHASPAAAGQPAADLLPLWREVFARPDTSLDAIPAPAGNPLTPAKIRLGKRLFSDTRLSGDNKRSCATCHDPARAFTDGRPRAASRDPATALLNTPTILDTAWATTFFHDARAKSLEDQAAHPVEHPAEMAGNWPTITARLSADASNANLFRDAFPANPRPSRETVTAALASYERSLVSPVSRFDRFIAGVENALSPQERAGFSLFTGKAGCVACHSGWRFTDGRRHDIGTSRPVKTPTLRALDRSAPYMHDGSRRTLMDVLRHYQALPSDRRDLAPALVRPLLLSRAEVEKLHAFLNSISD